MTYQETLDYLFGCLAMYQTVGQAAYKPGLDTARTLDAMFGSPSRRFRAIHVGGTNGKGSTSHSIAAVLQAAGLRVGLFTSPHLIDFRERIRINGEKIPREAVIDFVERYLGMANCHISPSFFELTTVMAFEWFAKEEVDVAVIEVGLGGRLDSTNILPSPLLSVITNISLDHTALLGNTLEQIAAEKAGIIRPGVPVVVGESGPPSVREVFASKAARLSAPIEFADDSPLYGEIFPNHIHYPSTPYGAIDADLCGDCQTRNMSTILAALAHLPVGPRAVKAGLSRVTESTGLMGRWMTLGHDPLVICDTGHNIGGWSYITPRLSSIPGHKEIVLGFVNDKDVTSILRLAATIPDATFRWTQASVTRAMPSSELASLAATLGIAGEAYTTVEEAYKAAHSAGSPTIFVGGSTFVVADLLALNS
ncbi:MAG: bifunctional folylpolyglutamate synthase/dihydrofolate synthase [Pseudoflavonifractor sp.]|nr:bifunctional folylpolyglutamate synthase/dihydrofolate synthase [Alloprevotella sp.]MCM1117261.1 bifunctional folylpolyglutamate synthase/dihydrofolate synthase [Pseudoflavonifractor sp.]